LSHFDVFHAIKLERLSHFAENALGHFETFSGQLKHIAFRLQKACERDEDRHNEPAKQHAQDEKADVFLL
jgi:hypothetical protein